MNDSAENCIYVSDMDGTLLQDDATLSPWAFRQLTTLLNEGVNFTVASARSVVAIRQVMGDLPFRLPVIAINGALITDYHTHQHIAINDMPTETVEHIYSRIIAHGMMPFMSAFDGKQDRLYYSELISGGMEWYHKDRTESGDWRLTRVDSIPEKFSDRIIALSVMNTYDKLKPLDEELQALDDHLENHFFENPYSPGWWWLTIHDKKACKARAVKTFLDYAGFTMDDLVVFGDNLNDINLFKMAHQAVAVENATEDVKQHASEIIGPNTQDSVVKYIMSHRMGS